jgi:O-antigen/teichoic acid export membrane protein
MSVFHSITRLFKHSAVYGIGHIISRSIYFLLLPLFTNIFPRDEYGVVGLMFTYIAILTILYTYGLDAAFFRFYILDDSSDKRKVIFSTAFFTILATSVLFSAFLFVKAELVCRLVFSSEVRQLSINLPYLIRLASGILFFDALSFLPFLILRAEERPVPFAIFKVVNVVINVGCNIFFLGFLKLDASGIFLANLAASAFTFLLLLQLTLKKIGLRFSLPRLKELFAFGIPYLPSTLAVVIMDTIDRPMLERLADIDAAGLYNAGVKLGMFMSLFVAAYRFAWHPFFLSTSKQDDAKHIFSRVFTYVLLACFSLFLVLSLFIDNIARIQVAGYSIIGKNYWEGIAVVPPVMLAYIFYAAYLNFLIGVYLEKKTKYLPYITIAGMAGNLAVNYFAIPVYGIMGAAWARTVAYLIMAVSLYFVGQRLYYIKYEWKKVVKLLLAVAIVFFVGKVDVIFRNVPLKSALLICFPLLLFVSGFFDRTERAKMKQLILRKVPVASRG